MSVLCGYASIDERGKVSGGKAGDQTGREVKTAPWYQFGQNVVLRFKDREKAKEAAECMRWLCDTNYVGYDQIQRTTAYNALKKLKWKYKKLKLKTETDCSQLISTVLNCVGIKVSPNIYTGNMVKALMDTGQFKKYTNSNLLKSDKFLAKGDIIINEKTHVIMALSNGKYYKNKIPYHYNGEAPILPRKGYYEKGNTGKNVARLQTFLAWCNLYKGDIDGSYGQNTVDAVKGFQMAVGIEIDGSFGKKSLEKLKEHCKK